MRDQSLTFTLTIYGATCSVTSLPGLAVGPLLFDLLAGRSNVRCGQDHRPVSRSVWPVNNSRNETNGISGPCSATSSQSVDLLYSLESKLAQRLTKVGSTECTLTWKRKVTPSQHSYCQLVPSMRPTEEIDWSLWQTPVADDAVKRAKGKINSRGEPKLSGQIMAMRDSIIGPKAFGLNVQTENTVVLNPAFLCWLMGFAIEWVFAAPRDRLSTGTTMRAR